MEGVAGDFHRKIHVIRVTIAQLTNVIVPHGPKRAVIIHKQRVVVAGGNFGGIGLRVARKRLHRTMANRQSRVKIGKVFS